MTSNFPFSSLSLSLVPSTFIFLFCYWCNSTLGNSSILVTYKPQTVSPSQTKTALQLWTLIHMIALVAGQLHPFLFIMNHSGLFVLSWRKAQSQKIRKSSVLATFRVVASSRRQLANSTLFRPFNFFVFRHACAQWLHVCRQFVNSIRSEQFHSLV